MNNQKIKHPRLRRPPLMISYAVMMIFCVINFDILRNLKESMLVTRLGAEAIPFIKVWAIVPAALIFLVTYSLLANYLSKRFLFIMVLLPFLVWMPLFSVVIYPNLDFFVADHFSTMLRSKLSDDLHIISALVYYWPLTVFYALAELWGAAVMGILFWTSVNDSYSTEAATGFYPFLVMAGNAGSILSGPMMMYCVAVHPQWGDCLITLSILFVIFGSIILILHEYCFRKTEQQSDKLSFENKKTTTCKPFFESVRYLSRSPYLGGVALMMLSYCIAINIVEVAWKNQVVQLYSTPHSYSTFMGKLTFFYGLGCIVCGVLLTFLLKRNWRTAALATPVIMAITAIPFFLMSMDEDQKGLLGHYTVDLLVLSVIVGMVNNVFSKSAKYTLFDVTKEIAFVPLNDEQKYKGKAAIELMVSRLGKSGSSFVQQFLIVSLGTLTLALPWLAGMFFIVVIIWLYAIVKLNKRYCHLVSEKQGQN